MISAADLVICDSMSIEKYIKKEYQKQHTTFIAYGSETTPSELSDNDPIFTRWMNEKKIQSKAYYLIVGRFVPENNYETMIREFMKSKTGKNLVIITNCNNKYAEELNRKLQYKKDQRIRFVGTVYNRQLLKKIREEAYAYIHGHEVGGTNPSLLEALGSTDLNLLLDVCFNREVGADAALYWKKTEGRLASLIDSVDHMPEKERECYSQKSKDRIQEAYTWGEIGNKYLKLWNESSQQ